MKSLHNIVIILLECNIAFAFKLIYQKDVSEHCRRRVMPSVFLGKQVVRANAELMQFSRLELPYSCFISVRTESGSNMVMVIQVSSGIEASCKKNNGQLLVYEIGETFGGYWGPLPDSVTKWDPPIHKTYTLRTTSTDSDPDVTNPIKENSEEVTTEVSSTVSIRNVTTGDYVEVEVPLVNVSIDMVPGKQEPVKSDIMDMEEVFDIHNDVTPVSGVPYDTSILPLVQFHLISRHEGRRQDGEPPRYDLDIFEQFTQDLRLTFPTPNPTSKKRKKHKYPFNRRLNLKKYKTLLDTYKGFDRQLSSQNNIQRLQYTTRYRFPTSNIPTTHKKIENNLIYTQNSWQIVEDLINRLNKTRGNIERSTETTLSHNERIILENISNMSHNKSVYLSPLLSANNHSNISSSNVSKPTTANSSLATLTSLSNIDKTKKYAESQTSIIKEDATTHSSSYSIDDKTEYNKFNTKYNEINESITEIYSKESISDNQNLNIAVQNVSNSFENTTKTYSSTSFTESKAVLDDRNENRNFVVDKTSVMINKVTGSMVGHESWENVVQAAPEMVVLLNQTIAYDTDLGSNISDNVPMEVNETLKEKQLLKRKKRYIHAIHIEDARPYNMTTIKGRTSTTKSSFEIGDMQDFAQLVELQDDEMHGRVALRYLRQYVGPSLFNICDHGDPGTRHVHLFNSSRILLSITNFTLERMIIILTSARTLIREARCPKSQLECQVAGARVCLDSMVACDGIPNCGSYDIYDEDRLLCGELASMKQNVYLAAFTSLIVLMAGLYAIHYWLKQYVSRVADAFFVYTDGTENELFLDSIMRSPNETDDLSKLAYQSHFFETGNLDSYARTASKENACKRFLRKICFCFVKKDKKTDMSIKRPSRSLAKRMYSFTELEIRNIARASTNASVQTGESLEMQFFKTQSKHCPKTKKTEQNEFVVQKFPLKIRDSSLLLDEPYPEEHTDELSVLKFFNNAKSDSIEVVQKKAKKRKESKSKTIMRNEKEIRSLAYDDRDFEQPGPSSRRTSMHEKGRSSKHLRFDEVAIAIPSKECESVRNMDTGNSGESRRNATLGESRLRHTRYLESIDEGEERVETKERRHFWGLSPSKAKKLKKKTHVSTLR